MIPECVGRRSLTPHCLGRAHRVWRRVRGTPLRATPKHTPLRATPKHTPHRVNHTEIHTRDSKETGKQRVKLGDVDRKRTLTGRCSLGITCFSQIKEASLHVCVSVCVWILNVVSVRIDSVCVNSETGILTTCIKNVRFVYFPGEQKLVLMNK